MLYKSKSLKILKLNYSYTALNRMIALTDSLAYALNLEELNLNFKKCHFNSIEALANSLR